jgi:hypothetical protein
MNSKENPRRSDLKQLLSTESKNKHAVRIKLFATGFLQVSLVTANTYLIAHLIYWAIFFAGFFISILWSYNVKSIAFGNRWDRILYALGCSVGAVAGLHIIHLVL